MRILLVEDDQLAAGAIGQLLTEHYYIVDIAQDGKLGLELAQAITYDLIILDVGLPKLDGMGLCQQLRSQDHTLPILLLTARNATADKIAGLNVGADDYVVKPFEPQELLARIRVLLRRSHTPSLSLLEWGELCLNPINYEATYAKQVLALTPKEYQLLELFLRQHQRVFSRNALIEHLWSGDTPPNEGTVTTHIMSLRRKLKLAGADPELIETVYGLGYRLKPLKTAVSNSAPAQQTLKAMANVWQEFQDKVKAKIAIFDQVATALQAESLTVELQQQAVQEAHRLAGSLGIFGFTNGSSLARSIEALLQTALLVKTEANPLANLVAALRLEIETTAKPPQPAPVVMPLILLIDDDTELAEQLRHEAIVWNINLEIVSDLVAARATIIDQPPNLILLDLDFSDGAENGFSLLAELSTYVPAIPTLVFTDSNQLSTRLQVMRLGGRAFLQKSLTATQVLKAATHILKQSANANATLLAVGDTEEDLVALESILQPVGFQLVTLNRSEQFWTVLEAINPDLLILDVKMPEISGIDLCRIVRQDCRWSDLPILFISAHTDAITLQQAFAAGADDYISKPINPSEMTTRILNRLERRSF